MNQRFKILLTTSVTAAAYVYNEKATQRNKCVLFAKEDGLKNLKLSQVQVVFRHGARTPLLNMEEYDTIFKNVIWGKHLNDTLDHTDIPISVKLPNGDLSTEHLADHYADAKSSLKGGMQLGQLTIVGQEQAYLLGKFLKDEYIKKHQLLSKSYLKKEISVRSSNVKRTLLTARCVMAGIFGKENLKEPVEISTRLPVDEQLYPNWGHCHRLKERFKFVEHHIRYLPGQHEMEELDKLIGYKNTHKPLHFVFLHDQITSREAHGLAIPEELKDYYPLIERRAAEHQGYILGGHNLDGVRLSTGSFLNDICKVLEDTSSGKQVFKMNLYSAHDTTLNALLMGLEQWNKTWPPYASYIAIELYKDMNTANDYYVRVVYNKKPLIMDKESTEETIPLERFLEKVEKYRVKDWNSLCLKKPDQ